MTSVYLAGPISGLLYGESTNWRSEVAKGLDPIECFSPLRFKSYLDGNGQMKDAYDRDVISPLSTSRGIMTRDYFDCQRADLVFVNFLGATRPSLGTAMEIAWAYQSHKPIVMAIEPSGNCHDHAMIREAVGFRVETLEEAISVTRSILLIEKA